MIRLAAKALVFAATLAVTVLPQATKLNAANQFDGPWSVVVYTLTGACDPSARFSGQILNGDISYAYGSLEVSGRVETSGLTHVHVLYGTARGEARGRLTATRGGGTWSGDGPDGHCAGTWNATRK